MNGKISDYYDFLKSKIAEIFPCEEVNGTNYFRNDDTGEYFILDKICGFNAIVVEYADDIHGAKNQVLEDGDLFGIDEYTKEEMLEKIIGEIVG
ncbi:MAG: hypothetical protein LUG65_03995 [Clostridiales bacterium]|nr:hypothetical protein [Clostridiales bacterium]